MKRQVASAGAKKRTEKQQQEAEAKDEEEEDEEDDDEGKPCGHCSMRATSSSAGPLRARMGSCASKCFKRTPSKDDGRQQSEEDEASDTKMLNNFYYLPRNNCAT
ncbi:hypothetical protein HYDPIDRAFT_31457 [Hydnomerulius pinastri MD-312]|uniref:Uncharacterized protein n=1 Tax=Hydnomerulius pinastri MD-312 TaxID=994086 RepID=A0A0C9WC46_9AGAM|nr:hypothetical protein HYDPIDRAFT_31457 [Hydnomerulius pinastri MD-312]